jgi:hypothetical protein
VGAEALPQRQGWQQLALELRLLRYFGGREEHGGDCLALRVLTGVLQSSICVAFQVLHSGVAFPGLQRGKLEMEQLFREVVPEQNRYGTQVGEGRGHTGRVHSQAGKLALGQQRALCTCLHLNTASQRPSLSPSSLCSARGAL